MLSWAPVRIQAKKRHGETRNEEGKQGAEGAAETTPGRFPTHLFSRGTQRLVQHLPCPLFYCGRAMEMEHNSCLFLFFQEHVEALRIVP
jgi:hypothetical protein